MSKVFSLTEYVIGGESWCIGCCLIAIFGDCKRLSCLNSMRDGKNFMWRISGMKK